MVMGSYIFSSAKRTVYDFPEETLMKSTLIIEGRLLIVVRARACVIITPIMTSRQVSTNQ